jgi:hypothetical protein
MNLQLNDSITFENLKTVLAQKLPQYKVELKKNPILRFEYVQIYKSAFVGVWIRIFPDKGRVTLIKAIPSTLARALFGGLIAILLSNAAQNRLRAEVAEVLKREFNTTEQK